MAGTVWLSAFGDRSARTSPPAIPSLQQSHDRLAQQRPTATGLRRTDSGLALRLRLPERRSAAALDERGLAHAHPPLSRRGWKPADVRLAPDPACDCDAPRQQRDAARRGEPVPRPFLDRRY